MDRRLLFPAVALTAWAQQPSPAAAEAEAALRARVQQFFQLQVEKKFRQGESMVAEDSKDDYYNGNKYNIKTFEIQKIELLDNNTRATVTLKSKVTVTAAMIGPVDFEVPVASRWKIENGLWVWYVAPEKEIQTPFGIVRPGQGGAPPSVELNKQGQAPDIAALQTAVKIDRNSVSLTADAPLQTVTVSNGLPGGVDLDLDSERIPGVSAELDRKHLGQGEKAVVQFRRTGDRKGSGVVRVMVSPTRAELDIHVNVN